MVYGQTALNRTVTVRRR